ncbi:unnamed protein product [Thlaspi arvense]|uniref:Reticulon-like protein n=1 Tax=Thlaspi arvense TaxID=13288 RepID=A0AAU9S1M3_THLAR|nr:unnamed protein product [Thlaspi arvense]
MEDDRGDFEPQGREQARLIQSSAFVEQSRSDSASSSRLSVHQSLGGGSVADLLLWRNRTGAAILLFSSTGFWFLFERAGYNLLSFVSNVLLLLVAILFLWAKSATVLNRPLPPVPNMEIPEEFAIKAADDLRVWINHVLSIASDITIARNPIRLLQVSFVLWAISYVGTLINSLTLVYIGILLSLSVPIVYEKYQDHIDEKLNSTSTLIRSISRKIPLPIDKEKKYQIWRNPPQHIKTPQTPPKAISSLCCRRYIHLYLHSRRFPPPPMATPLSLSSVFSSRLSTTTHSVFPIRRRELNRRRIILVTSSAGGGKPTILVAEKLGQAGIDLLRKFANVDCSYDLSLEELCTKISLCDALIVRSGTKVGRDVFESSRGRLKVVGRAGVGIDNVDLAAATEYGKWTRNKYVGVSLVGKTLAVLGFGKVGSEVARRARGLGMHVITHDPYAPADRARAIGVELVSFEVAISTADFISLHLPLTAATSKMLNDETFARMKKGVRIVNVARGGVIDEEALLRALDSGVVAQAALDVFTVEPPVQDNKLVLHESVTATPHLGASTMEAQEGVAIEIAEAVVGALQGELAATAVNAPMVPPQVLKELKPYVVLAEKLGRLAVQLVTGGSGVDAVKVTYASSRSPDDLDTRLLRAMVIKGLIEPISSVFINLVNSDYIAKQRGVKISEERMVLDGSPENPIEYITVRIANVESRFASALSASGEIKVEGRVKQGVPSLTKVGLFEVDVSLEGSVILCRQVDQPGMIGRVGGILGDENVNVSFMSVGRIAPGKQAVMAIGVDEQPSKETLKKIGDISAIEEFVFLKL